MIRGECWVAGESGIFLPCGPLKPKQSILIRILISFVSGKFKNLVYYLFGRTGAMSLISSWYPALLFGIFRKYSFITSFSSNLMYFSLNHSRNRVGGGGWIGGVHCLIFFSCLFGTILIAVCYFSLQINFQNFLLGKYLFTAKMETSNILNYFSWKTRKHIVSHQVPN